jgi:hypothetical protein
MLIDVRVNGGAMFLCSAYISTSASKIRVGGTETGEVYMIYGTRRS